MNRHVINKLNSYVQYPNIYSMSLQKYQKSPLQIHSLQRFLSALACNLMLAVPSFQAALPSVDSQCIAAAARQNCELKAYYYGYLMEAASELVA
mmetsp:Transcript_31854/g.40872  ORF Transcript_31854/g.40872 Transcript_31854/m.40872 type:complete len:94 (+) Transcript_31854:56-337(+)